MSILYRYLALSDDRPARLVRKLYWGINAFSVPAPKVIVTPVLWALLAIRSVYYWVMRVFICEPLFKAYCKQYGRGLRTDVYIHWVQGKGDIILGDKVQLCGKSSFAFLNRYEDTPELVIGDHTFLGHDCTIAVGSSIRIGRHCLLAGGVAVSDYDGHPIDAMLRRTSPAPRDSIRPVVIGDDVWIGADAKILKGVTIGDRSIVGAGAVVTKSVPPDVIVAGNPARVVKRLVDPAPNPAKSCSVTPDREPDPNLI